MKLKLKFGEGGAKGALARHGEKVAFGVVLALVVGFLYASATKQGFPAAKSPLNLRDSAEAAKQSMGRDTWRDIAPERVRLIATDIPAAKVLEDPQWLAGLYQRNVEEGRAKIREDSYATSTVLSSRIFPSQFKRRDPKLLPATKVEAYGGYYAVALRLTKPDSAWAGDKDAVEKPSDHPSDRPKAKPDAKKAGRGKTGSGSGSSDDYGMYGKSGGRGGSSGPPTPGGYPGMTPPMGSGSGTGYEDSYPSPGGSMGSTGAGKRRLSKPYLDYYYPGLQGPGGMGTALAPNSRQGARSFGLVAVKALVPYEKQFAEYEAALADAIGYSVAQDTPRYFYFFAERAEVPDDPKAELEWKPITNTGQSMRAAMTEYATFPKEIADEAYTLPGLLTMPIPPVLLNSYDPLALHSDIPRRQLRPTAAVKPKEEAAEAKPEAGGEPEGIPDLSKAGPGGMTMQPGGGYPMPGPGMPGTEGGMSGYPAPGGMGGYPTTGSMGSGGYPMPGGQMGSGGYPMPGAGGMPGYGTGNEQVPKVKYKLVRFYDLTAEPGKAYRYRVRLLLEDPNRPFNRQADPNKRILDKTVLDRFAKEEAEDQEYLKKTGKERPRFVRTEWSEPSNIVRVEDPEKVIAGAASPGKMILLSADGPAVQTTEPSGKVVAVVWDKTRAVEVPAEREVNLGSVLNFKQNADVLHPLAGQIKTLEEYNFITEAFVADLRGGEELSKKGKDQQKGLTAPAEYLVVDRKGNLIACNEVDDAEDYRRLLFIDDKTGSDRSNMNTMPAMEYPTDMMPGYGGGDYFSPGGSR